jgi:hypothetical protein
MPLYTTVSTILHGMNEIFSQQARCCVVIYHAMQDLSSNSISTLAIQPILKLNEKSNASTVPLVNNNISSTSSSSIITNKSISGKAASSTMSNCNSSAVNSVGTCSTSSSSGTTPLTCVEGSQQYNLKRNALAERYVHVIHPC